MNVCDPPTPTAPQEHLFHSGDTQAALRVHHTSRRLQGQLHPLHFCSCRQLIPKNCHVSPERSDSPPWPHLLSNTEDRRGPTSLRVSGFPLLPRAFNHHHETLHSSRLWCDQGHVTHPPTRTPSICYPTLAHQPPRQPVSLQRNWIKTLAERAKWRSEGGCGTES